MIVIGLIYMGGGVNTPTISEGLFEELCSQRGVACTRIPRAVAKTADYRVSLGLTTLIVEIKQLDLSDEDKNLEPVWGTQNSPIMEAPANRVRGLLTDAYPQIKNSNDGRWPTMIVVYNNSADWNYIDSFTVSTAMFGTFGADFRLQPGQPFAVTRYGYMGGRKVTTDTFRSLSVVGVLKRLKHDVVGLACYHNPFTTIPVEPTLLNALANEQYVHPNPHDRDFVQWAPTKIET